MRKDWLSRNVAPRRIGAINRRGVALRLLIAGAATVGFSAAAANAASPKAWKDEPSSFLGISLDSTFPGAMQECPTKGSGALRFVDPGSTARMTTMCVGPAFQNMYQIYAGPKLGFGYELNAFTYDGRVGMFLLTSHVANFSAMKDLLSERFGAPRSKQSLAVTTKGGGKFTSERLTWSGKKVNIVLDQLSSDINTSSISVQTSAYTQAQRDEAGKAARANASKL